MNLGRYVRRMARYQGDAEAVVCGGERLSYTDLDERSDRLAHALQGLGLEKGDCVATLSWNCAALVVTEVALYKAGLVRAPINARLSAEEAAHLLRESAARVLLVDADHLQVAETAVPASKVETVIGYDGVNALGVGYEDVLQAASRVPIDVECADGDLAVLHFTSGSTGKLKAAMQTYGNRQALMRKKALNLDSRIGPGCKEVLAGPITHASGMALMGIFFAGGCAVVMPQWDAEDFLATIERERATHAFLVPTMINMVLALPTARDYDLSSLRHVLYGAAPMSAQRVREAWKLFGPVLAQGYGAGETTSGVLFLSTDDHRRAIEGSDEELLLSCGRALGEADVKIVDDTGADTALGEIGEIVVRGPDVVPGYLGEPELTASAFRDGWFLTGDLGRCREDGYIFIVDRKKDMIISGGFNIYAVEVESTLHEHPAVFEAAVVGVPDAQWGEAVKAVVVLREGSDLDESALIEFCADHLARMKKPQSVDFVSALPHSPNGKIDRRAIRDRYWVGAARRVH